MKNMILNTKKGLTLLEISIVMIIVSVLFSFVYMSTSLVQSSKLSNSINLTSKVNFLDDNGLVLWVETSTLTKIYKNNTPVDLWKDLSKYRNNLEVSSTGAVFRDSRVFPWLKCIYLNGASALSSANFISFPNKYTIFVVLAPDSDNASNLYNNIFSLSNSELSGGRIIEITDNGTQKCIKKSKNTDFSCSSSEFSPSSSNKNTKFVIGNNGFKGEVFDIIIFKRVLESSKIKEIEEYLYNKYMVK